MIRFLLDMPVSQMLLDVPTWTSQNQKVELKKSCKNQRVTIRHDYQLIVTGAKKYLAKKVPNLTCQVLNTYGYEGVHANQIGKNRAADSELLEIARRDECIIITADLDFPRLLALSLAEGPCIILFRGGNYSNLEMCELLERVLNEVSPEIFDTSICVVDKKRIRITQLPINRKN